MLVYEYPFHDKDIDISFAEIHERYPDSGFVLNEKVKEMIFVEEGEGKIMIENREYKLKKDDVVLVLPNKKYFYEGNLKLIISSSPAWYPAQHKRVDN